MTDTSSAIPKASRRELTVRALATGMVLGAVLTPSNVYSGLKIGWSFNMSIIALLLGFGLWWAIAALGRGPQWTPHESNINQTTASSAASIISGGLVAPIPASISLVMAFGALVAWLFAARFPTLAARFVIAAAAGLIAGESIVGVAASFWEMMR
jgi:uncharacterized oligopeptide transporter (OPT) family protein